VQLAAMEDPSVAAAAVRRTKGYKGVPRNILRHVLVSGIDSTMTSTSFQ